MNADKQESPSDTLTLTKTFECSRKAIHYHYHTPAPHIVRTEEQSGVVIVVVTELTEDLQKSLAELKRKNEMQKGETNDSKRFDK